MTRRARHSVLALALLVLAPARAEAARVESFAPTGVAKQVRQVSARFSEAMVPFGDPRARDPGVGGEGVASTREPHPGPPNHHTSARG